MSKMSVGLEDAHWDGMFACSPPIIGFDDEGHAILSRGESTGKMLKRLTFKASHLLAAAPDKKKTQKCDDGFIPFVIELC